MKRWFGLAFFTCVGCAVAAAQIAVAQTSTPPSPECQAKIKEWDHWYKICIIECKDIAQGYTFKNPDSPASQALYKKELKTCITACDGKYAYYKDSLC